MTFSSVRPRDLHIGSDSENSVGERKTKRSSTTVVRGYTARALRRPEGFGGRYVTVVRVARDPSTKNVVRRRYGGVRNVKRKSKNASRSVVNPGGGNGVNTPLDQFGNVLFY